MARRGGDHRRPRSPRRGGLMRGAGVMTVDQLDELIRKYLSTGVAMVLVLVGPAAAPSGATAPQAATTSAHSTGAPPTNSRSPSRSDTDERDPTGGSYDSRAKPTAEPDATRNPPPTPRAKPTAEPDADPKDNGRSSRDTPTAAATHGWGTPNREDDFTERPVRLGYLRRPRPRRQGHPLTRRRERRRRRPHPQRRRRGHHRGHGLGQRQRPEVRPLGRPGPRPRRRPAPTTPSCCSGPTPRTSRRAARSTSWR